MWRLLLRHPLHHSVRVGHLQAEAAPGLPKKTRARRLQATGTQPYLLCPAWYVTYLLLAAFPCVVGDDGALLVWGRMLGVCVLFRKDVGGFVAIRLEVIMTQKKRNEGGS